MLCSIPVHNSGHAFYVNTWMENEVKKKLLTKLTLILGMIVHIMTYLFTFCSHCRKLVHEESPHSYVLFLIVFPTLLVVIMKHSTHFEKSCPMGMPLYVCHINLVYQMNKEPMKHHVCTYIYIYKLLHTHCTHLKPI